MEDPLYTGPNNWNYVSVRVDVSKKSLKVYEKDRLFKNLIQFKLEVCKDFF